VGLDLCLSFSPDPDGTLLIVLGFPLDCGLVLSSISETSKEGDK